MSSIPLTEELDFAYLLELMPPLHDVPEFAWLPELFSIIGVEKLILLCRYAGGESITIPTLDQLDSSVQALQWFYNTEITRTKSSADVPPELKQLVAKIQEVYDARYGRISD